MPRQTITLEEAKELSRSQAGVHLDITSGLTPEIASLIIQSKGGISLNYLTVLTDEVAEILSTYSGDLQLGGARLTASPEAIGKLSEHKGGFLAIQRLLDLNIDVARHLSVHQGQLRISSFKDSDFTDEVLIELAKHDGDLFITSKISLTEPTIKALLAHSGYLMLPMCENYTPEIGKKFKKHNGPVSIAGNTIKR